MEDRSVEFEDINDEDIDLESFEDPESGPLFWSLKLEKDKPKSLAQPVILGYIVHVTHCCFGANVAKGSRTVVMIKDDNDEQIPICVLSSGKHENEQLDLLFNESVEFVLKGQKVSDVYLTGYLQPPVEPDVLDGTNPLGASLEDLTEEEIKQYMKFKKQGESMQDDDDDDEDIAPQLMNEDIDIDIDINDDERSGPPPQKKQKLEKGKSKITKKSNENNSNKNHVAKKRKIPTKNDDDEKDEKMEETPKSVPKSSPKASPKTSPKNAPKKITPRSKEKTSPKSSPKIASPKPKKKKKKKMQMMKGGIKYKDIKVGSGAPIVHGQKVRVFYVGQLEDKNVFDKSISGNGFEFEFGANKVIKGWDLGLKGMKVGGKRKLVIPPKLGYDKEGNAPEIPPNATLTFTIEVKGISQ